MVEVPAGRGKRHGAGGVACGVGFKRTVGVRALGGPQRAVRPGQGYKRRRGACWPAKSATTEWPRPGVAGRRRRRAFVVVDVGNLAMCRPGMAERHGVTAGGEHMNKMEMAGRLAARTGLSKGAARDAVDGVFAIIGERLPMARMSGCRASGHSAPGAGQRAAVAIRGSARPFRYRRPHRRRSRRGKR